MALLEARGAPKEHPLLAVSWRRDASEPYVNKVPHYTSCGKNSPSPPLHLFRGAEGRWQIAPEVGAGLAYAVANGPATHPNTVRAGEWLVPVAADGSNWQPAKDFVLKLESFGTEARPLLLEELGEDFFMRVRATKLVWFVDPKTGLAAHSGAKAAGSHNKPGVRYCPVCDACFSANNFQSQHIPNLHRPPAPSAPLCAADGFGGALVTWRTPQTTEMTTPVSFCIECSVGGGSWDNINEDTLNPESKVAVPAASLNIGKSYRFRVATHTVGSRGPFSTPSAPFVASATGIALPMPDGSDLASALGASLASAPFPTGGPPPVPTGGGNPPPPPAAQLSGPPPMRSRSNDQFTPPVSPPVDPPILGASPPAAIDDAAADAAADAEAFAVFAATTSGIPGVTAEALTAGSSEIDGNGRIMKRRLEDASADDLLDLAGPDGLTWSLEEMWEIMTSSSQEAKQGSSPSRSMLDSLDDDDGGGGKRARHADPTAGFFSTAASSTASETDTELHTGNWGAAGFDVTQFDSPEREDVFAAGLPEHARLSRTRSSDRGAAAVASGELDLSMIMHDFAKKPLAPNYREGSFSERSDIAMSSIDELSVRKEDIDEVAAAVPPTPSPDTVVPPPTPLAASKPKVVKKAALLNEEQRLSKLRAALSGVSAASRARQINAEVLKRVSGAGWTRELALLLTYATPASAEAAAATDAGVRKMLRAQRAMKTGKPPNGNATTVVVKIAKSASPRPLAAGLIVATALLLLLALVMGSLTGPLGGSSANEESVVISGAPSQCAVRSTGFLNSLMKRPASTPCVPECHFSWLRGCVPANEATAACSTRPHLIFGRALCRPSGLAS